jgi:hypothetical protein
MREVIITRDIRYEIRLPLDRTDEIPPVIELRDMTIVNDSGPQIFIEEAA